MLQIALLGYEQLRLSSDLMVISNDWILYFVRCSPMFIYIHGVVWIFTQKKYARICDI